MIKKAPVLIIIAILILNGTIISKAFSFNETNKNLENSNIINEKTGFPATGFIYVTQDENGVWWFINATGEKFYSIGMQCTMPNDIFYEDIDSWVDLTENRLENWGFNCINWDWEGNNIYSKDKYHYVVVKLEYYGDIAYGWKNKHIPDVFNEDWVDLARTKINETAIRVKDDPDLLGYMIENEIKWAPLEPSEYDPAINNLTLLEEFMNAPKETPGKKRLVKFLRERYDNDSDMFNLVYNMDIDCFDDLFDHTRFGYNCWPLVTKHSIFKLGLYRQYPVLKHDKELFKRAKKDVVDFNVLYAETFFNTTDQLLKEADPNHMNLGCRDSFFGSVEEVIEVAGKYVDCISYNYYRGNKLFLDADVLYMQEKYGYLSSNDWLKKYYDVSGKPILITEFEFGKYDDTDKDKGKYWNWYAKNSFNAPYVVGFTKFAYMDRLILFDWGIVNIYNEPKEDAVSYVQNINKKAVNMHERSYERSFSNNQISTLNLNKNNIGYNLLNKLLNKIEKTNSKDCEILEVETSSIVKKNNLSEFDIYVNNGSLCPGDGSRNWPYCKIQYAIENASNKDSIYVFNGSYFENILIDKEISLVGESRNNTFLYGTPQINDNKIIIIEANNVNITGFNITSLGGIWHHDTIRETCNGVYINNYENCNISGNSINKTGHYGIKALRSKNITINDNIITNILHKSGCCIFLDSCDNACVEDNYLDICTISGIWYSRGKDSIVKDNVIFETRITAIFFDRADSNLIFGNNLLNNEIGVMFRDSSSNTITCNNFDNADKNAYFIRSYENDWNENFWSRSRVLPKMILGVKGADEQLFCIDFDWKPLDDPYSD